jgi:hypothetical protein
LYVDPGVLEEYIFRIEVCGFKNWFGYVGSLQGDSRRRGKKEPKPGQWEEGWKSHEAEGEGIRKQHEQRGQRLSE